MRAGRKPGAHSGATTTIKAVGLGRGGGKVILLGEHSVVYGYTALAAGIGLGVDAVANRTDSGFRLTIDPWALDLRVGESDSPLALAFSALLDAYPKFTGGVHVHLTVDLPGGAGLGCSAAMGVATCEALDSALEVYRTEKERGDFCMVWESVFHGTPSGVDNALAARGGIAAFVRGQPLEPIVVNAPLSLVIAHSGETSSTKEVVAMVARQRERNPKRVDEVFEAINSLVRNACLALTQGQIESVGTLMDRNQNLLSSLMLSTSKIEDLCHAAREAGALGAKLTGAGSGGCVVALCAGAEQANAVEAAMAPFASMTFQTLAG